MYLVRPDYTRDWADRGWERARSARHEAVSFVSTPFDWLSLTFSYILL